MNLALRRKIWAGSRDVAVDSVYIKRMEVVMDRRQAKVCSVCRLDGSAPESL